MFDDRLFLRVGKDAHRALGLSRTQQLAMVESGELPPLVQLSPRIRGWRVATLEAWLQERERRVVA